MSDHPLEQLDPPSPHGSDGTSNNVRTRKRDMIPNAIRFFRSKTKEAKSKTNEVKSKTASLSLHSRPASQQSTRPSSVVSHTSSYQSCDNMSAPSSTAMNKPLPLPPSAEALSLTEIFAENQSKLITRIELPRLQERIERTDQLVYCITLLIQDSISPPTAVSGKATTGELVNVLQGPILDKVELDWLDETKKDPMEAGRLRWLTTRMVDQFVTDVNKDSNKVAEIVSLGPVLQKESFRKLLSTFIKEFEDTRILDIDILQGLVQLVQVAFPGHLVSDDLIKILSIIRVRLEGTHQQSTEHSYHLTLAVSRILDVMADHKVQDVARVLEHEPLSTVLSGLKGSSDPYLMYQACYAFQALQYVPDDETALHAVLRHSTDVAMGLVKISSVLKLDLSSVLDGLASMYKALESTMEVVGSTYESVWSLKESGRGFLGSVKEGLGCGQKRPWYPAVKAAYAFANAGQLKDLKQLALGAPCRYDPLFQWGICQLLGEIAVDPIWPTATRQQAISLLDHLYRDDQEWGCDESIKAWTVSVVTNIRNTPGQEVNATASTFLHDLKQNHSTTPQYRFPLLTRLRIPVTSSLLAKMQDIPYLEYDLHKLRLQRLEEAKLPVYIPPMAKANLQARDDDLFPLMDKVQEFLTSDRKVMLVLGDSGAGKSTFNKHLETELLESYKCSGPIPLFINLPAIDRPDKDLITEHLRTINFSEEQIKELKQYRQFILICDGYDESQLTVNLHTTNHFNRPGQWNVKMVISCRTQFLGQEYRRRFVPEGDSHYNRPTANLFQEAVIAPFFKKQIKDYVEQYVPLEPRTWTTKDYMDRLTTIPSLLDLVRNPFLLSLSLEALPGVTEGRQNLSAIKISRVQLYDTFVRHWLDVNSRRLLRNILCKEDRETLDQLLEAGFTSIGIDFSTRLATAIFGNQDGNPVVQYIHHNDEGSWRTEFFGPDPKARLLRESSPLTRTGNQFRFVHRSMLEYFLSCAVFDPNHLRHNIDVSPQSNSRLVGFYGSQILDAESVLFKCSLLSEPSVIQFLCERVKQHSDFKEWLLAVIYQSKSDATAVIAAANAITILVRAGVRFNSADLRGIRVSGADLSDGQFDSTQFQGADLTGVKFSRSWLRQANFSNALMEGVHFGELPYLKKEDDWIETCAFSPDGRMFAVCPGSGGIEMYDTTTWTKIRGLGRRKYVVWNIVFSPDSEHIVSASNISLRLWDITSGKTLHVLQGHTYRVNSVAFSPCGKQIASSSIGKTVRLWSSETGKEIFVLEGHTEAVRAVKYAPDRKRLVSSSDDGTVRFWDPETGNPGPVCNAYLGRVLSLDYSPDGRRVASGHDRGDICLWDADSGDLHFTFHSILRDVGSVAFSPDGQWIVSSGTNRIVVVYDSSTGLLVSIFSGHTHFVESCAFSPDGLQIASRDGNGIVRLWDANSRMSTLPNSDRIAGGVSKVAYSPDGRFILSLIRYHGIQRWDTFAGASEYIAINMMENVCLFTLSPDGRQIATGNDNGIIRLWNSQTGTAERTLIGSSWSAKILVYSPCGRWILSVDYRGQMEFWDLHNVAIQSHVVYKCTLPGGFLRSTDTHIAFSPIGHQLVIGTSVGYTLLFNLQNENPCSPVKEMTCTSVCSLAYSPDGQRLVIGSNSGSLHFWDLQSETTVIELEGHASKVSYITYSPCGRWLLSGSNDGTIRLWQLRTSEADDSWSCVAVVHGCSESINCLAWNPVVPMEFVSGCEDESVRVWKISIGDDGRVELVRMLWGNDVGRLCVSGLTFKGAIGLSPISQRLLMQRGAEGGGYGLEGDGGGSKVDDESNMRLAH